MSEAIDQDDVIDTEPRPIHRCACGGEMMEWSAANCFGGDPTAPTVLRCPRCGEKKPARPTKKGR